jgi:hypothetical protein
MLNAGTIVAATATGVGAAGEEGTVHAQVHTTPAARE